MSTTIKVYDEALHRQVEEYMAAHKLSQEPVSYTHLAGAVSFHEE